MTWFGSPDDDVTTTSNRLQGFFTRRQSGRPDNSMIVGAMADRPTLAGVSLLASPPTGFHPTTRDLLLGRIHHPSTAKPYMMNDGLEVRQMRHPPRSVSCWVLSICGRPRARIWRLLVFNHRPGLGSRPVGIDIPDNEREPTGSSWHRNNRQNGLQFAHIHTSICSQSRGLGSSTKSWFFFLLRQYPPLSFFCLNKKSPKGKKEKKYGAKYYKGWRGMRSLP